MTRIMGAGVSSLPAPPVLEYGYMHDVSQYYPVMRACQCQCTHTCTGRDAQRVHACCGASCTFQLTFLITAFILTLAVAALAAASTSPAQPWMLARAFNGSASDSGTFLFETHYSRDGRSSTSRVCSNWRHMEDKFCVHNPSWYAPPPLSSLAASVGVSIDVPAANSVILPLTLVAMGGAIVTAVGVAALHRTASLPYPGTARVHSVPMLVTLVACAVTVGVAFQSAALGVWSSAVYDPLLSNSTVIIQATGRPADSLPQPVQIDHVGGYGAAAAYLSFLIVILIPVGAAALTAPRWFWGTRREYYEAAARQLEAATAAAPQPLVDEQLSVGVGVPVNAPLVPPYVAPVPATYGYWGTALPSAGLTASDSPSQPTMAIMPPPATTIPYGDAVMVPGQAPQYSYATPPIKL